MESPEEKSQSSRPSFDWRRLSAGTGIMCVILAIATALLAEKPSQPHPKWGINDIRWWITPWENHASLEIASTNVDINEIAVTRDGSSIYAVGNGGLFLRSPDSGRSWERLTIKIKETTSVTSSQNRSSAGKQSPALLSSGKARVWDRLAASWFDLIPQAEAAEAPLAIKSVSVEANLGVLAIRVDFSAAVNPSLSISDFRIDGATGAIRPTGIQTIPSEGVLLYVADASPDAFSKFQVCYSRQLPSLSNQSSQQAVQSSQPICRTGSADVSLLRQKLDTATSNNLNSVQTQNAAPVTGGSTSVNPIDSNQPPRSAQATSVPSDTPATKSAASLTPSKTNPNGSARPASSAPPQSRTSGATTIIEDLLQIALSADESILYIRDRNNNLYYSSDRGTTWSPSSTSSFNERGGISASPPKFPPLNEFSVSPDSRRQLADDLKSRNWPSPSATVNAELVLQNEAWLVGLGGAIFHLSPGSKRWSAQQSETSEDLTGITGDGRRLYVVGHKGTILFSEDSGTHWNFLLRPDLPAPGQPKYGVPPITYAFALLTILFAIAPALKYRSERHPEPVSDIEQHAASDRPLEPSDPDPLNFRSIAAGISGFLRNTKTYPPLTIGIVGEWGSGKSSIMNLLRADLKKRGFHPVWFNAWHHQKEEYLLAALLQTVRLESVPRWWQPRGVPFRCRLVWYRVQRYWIALVLLTFALAFLWHLMPELLHIAAAVPSFATKPGENWSDLVVNFLDHFFPKWAAIIPPLIVVTAKCAQAFGVKPAALLASAARGSKVSDLDAQTSFRQKFAEEFCDVTRALGKRTMTIFIDDLDRCRPENVRDILEAVNFIVSSGDCFVVLGMSREPVEAAVGLSFKDVADELASAVAEAPSSAPLAVGAAASASPGGETMDSRLVIPPPSPAPSAVLNTEESRQKRRAFAKKYLEKLINIEIPVPPPSSPKAADLMLPQADAQPKGLIYIDRIKFAIRILAVLFVTAGLIIGGLDLGTTSESRLNALRTSPNPAPSVSSTASASGTAGAASTGAVQTTPTESKTAGEQTKHPMREASGQVPTFTPGQAPIFASGLAVTPLWIMLLLLGGIFYWAATRESVETQDSRAFKTAVQVWSPVVLSRYETPRSVKRFMNWVRFLAMSQRGAESSVSDQTTYQRFAIWALQKGWHRVADWVTRVFVRSSSTDSAERRIDDDMLVALAALYFRGPEFLDPSFLTTASKSVSPSGFSTGFALPIRLDGDAAAVLAQAVYSSRSSWMRMLPNRERFLNLISGSLVR